MSMVASPSAVLPMALRYMAVTASLGGVWAIQLVTFLIVVRLAGLHTYGVYAALMAPLAILTEMGGIGAGYRLMRAVARDPRAHGAALGQALKSLGLSLLPLLAVYLTFVALGLEFTAPWPLIVLLGVSELTFTRLVAWSEQATIAHGSHREANVVRLVFPVLRLAVFAASPFLVVMSIEWLLILHVGVNAVAGLGLMGWVWLRFGGPSGRLDWAELRGGVPFALSEATRAAQGNIDRVTLSLLAPAAVLGLYVTAGRILQVALFPITALLRITFPTYFQRGGTSGVRGTFGLARQIALPVAGLALVGAAGIFVLADFIPLLLGSDFTEAVPLIRTMVWVVLPIGLSSVAADALSGAEMQPTRLWLYATSVVVQTLILVLVVPPLGLTGAVIALYAGVLIYCGMLWTVLYRRSRQ